MDESRDFAAMPILSGALLDAGCENADLLAPGRGPCPHVRGCRGAASGTELRLSRCQVRAFEA